jgi:sortase A
MAWVALPREQPFLRWTRWLFLALGVVLLGYVAFAFADAKVFQAYENWRLDHAAKSAPSSPATTAPAGTPPSPTREAPRQVALAGATIGRIEISRIGVDAIIVEGTEGRSLRRAVGHIVGTSFPGYPGNSAIAGHRDTFFRALRDVRQDDEIIVTTLDGRYRYQVDSMKIVGPEATDVLNDSGGSTLTLVTCYPFYYVGPAPQRFIVRAHRN